jgi:hypothetical protein
MEATEAFLIDLYYQFDASIMELMSDNMVDHRLQYRSGHHRVERHDSVPGEVQRGGHAEREVEGDVGVVLVRQMKVVRDLDRQCGALAENIRMNNKMEETTYVKKEKFVLVTV